MNKNLVTEFSTEWIKYSEYTTKKVPFGDEYIVPKKNAKSIKYKISEVADQMIMDYINIGKAFEFEKYKVKDMIIEFVNNYGLIGIISYMPLNFNYLSSEKIFLNSSNDLGMEEIWDRKEYLEYFFPFDLKEKFKFKGNEIYAITNEETTDEEVFWGGAREFSIPFSKYYAEKIEDIGIIANRVYNQFIAAYTFDFETPYIERTFKGLDFFKARNITINAKAGDTHFSLQWVFNSLASALDTILLVKICDKNQPLRICKHCGKLFIAENVRAEYDTPQCRNQANVYKSREKNKGEHDD